MRVISPVVNGEKLPLLLNQAEFSNGTGGQIGTDDPRLEPLLAGASAAIRRYCGWHIGPVIEDDYRLDYEGGGILVLPTLHLVEVSKLSVGGKDLYSSTLEWSENGEIRLPYHMRSRWRGVEITMQHGWDLEALSDLKQVVQQVVGNAISSPLGATREQAGAVSVSWATTAPGVSGGISLLERDLAMVNQYKLPKGA